MDMFVLGSGSGGNSTLLRTRGRDGGGAILIDAGFGPQSTAKRLAAQGQVTVGEIKAICLTHLDRDHINLNWLATLVKQQIRVYCHDACVLPLRRMMLDFAAGRPAMVPAAELVTGFGTGEQFEPVPGVRLETAHFPHDEAGSHGFLITVAGAESVGNDEGIRPWRIGYATDLGRVPEMLIEWFAGVDVLALESNYDREMELASDRPWMLKQRVMGGRGHLSNEEAFAAVRAILDATERLHGAERLPRHIVLLHRSRECNCPKLLRRLFERDARIKARLILAEQHEATPWLGREGAIRGTGVERAQLQLHWG